MIISDIDAIKQAIVDNPTPIETIVEIFWELRFEREQHEGEGWLTERWITSADDDNVFGLTHAVYMNDAELTPKGEKFLRTAWAWLLYYLLKDIDFVPESVESFCDYFESLNN